MSYEGGLTYNDKKVNINVVLFSNITKNQIVKSQESKDGKFYNTVKNLSGKTNAYGYEIDVQYVPVQELKFVLNHAYAKAYNIGQNQDIPSFFARMPIAKTNFLSSYTVSQKYPLNVAFVGRCIHAIRNGDGTNSAGYTMFDVNFIFPVVKQLSVEFQVRNMFNKAVNDFSYIAVPMSKRTFLLTVSTKF